MPERDALEALERQVAALTHELGVLQDKDAIKSLQYKYGYYIDKCLYDEAVDLFAEDARLHFFNGVWKGRAGVRRLYCDWFRNLFTNGHNGPIYGFLLDHLQLQGVIDVAPDRHSAKGRFRSFLQGGSHRSKPDPIPGVPDQFWESGIYENTYVKEAGVWKIQVFNYNMLWQANYREGWTDSGVHIPPLTVLYPEDPKGPDEIFPEVPKTWPETRVVPFHYPHPVTGKPWLQGG